jgi:hypothetical protein
LFFKLCGVSRGVLGGKPFVLQFHRKAFSLFNSICALNALPNQNVRQAQINIVSRSARVTFSAIFENAGGSAFVRRRSQVQKAIVKMHTNAHDLKSLTNGSNRSLRSLGLAKASPLTKR